MLIVVDERGFEARFVPIGGLTSNSANEVGRPGIATAMTGGVDAQPSRGSHRVVRRVHCDARHVAKVS
jgi:hypothetical protein